MPVSHDIYLELHGKNANVQDPGAGGTFKFDGVGRGVTVLTATGTYTLPDEPRGVTLLIVCDDTSVITVADGGGTIGSFTGTTNGSAARVTKLGDLGTNSWGFELLGDAIGEAATIGIADVGGHTEATTVESALQVALRSALTVRVPITSFVDADGDPLAKYSAAPTPGFALENSEAYGLKWGAHATPSVAMSSILLPIGLGLGHGLTMHVLASKSGATLADATTFTVTAFCNEDAELHDAGSDIGGTTSAMTGNATAKTCQHLTLAMTVPDIGSPTNLTFTLKPTNGTLGTDNVIVEAVYFTATI